MPAGNVVYFYVREEEKNPAVFKRRKGKREWGVKIMGPTHSALLRTFCHVWSK